MCVCVCVEAQRLCHSAVLSELYPFSHELTLQIAGKTTLHLEAPWNVTCTLYTYRLVAHDT